MGIASGNRWNQCLAVVCMALSAVLSAVVLGPVTASAAPAAAPPASDLWPTFGHGPQHSGLSSDHAIAASTAAGLKQLWSASPGVAIASPAVAYSEALRETLVYDVTYSGLVSAFKASSGTRVWQRTVGAPVSSSPAVYNGTIYFGTMNGTLEALNAATGAVECTFTLPVVAPATKPGRLISSPVVGVVDSTGPTVFLGDAGLQETSNGGHFWAITGVGNTAGGCRKKWMYDNWPNRGTAGTATGVWDEPALALNKRGAWEVVFGSSNPDQSVYALNAAKGSLLWRFHTAHNSGDEDVGAGPTIERPDRRFPEGVVYVDGKDGIEYALNLRTGTKIWSFTLGGGGRGSNAVSEAALTGNTLVVCFHMTAFALNAKTGAVKWKVMLGSQIHASPAVSGPSGDQVLFVGDVGGTEYGFNLRSGATVFTAATGSQLQASAAVAVGKLYFTSGSTLFAYSPS